MKMNEMKMSKKGAVQEKDIRLGPEGAKSEKIQYPDGSIHWRLTGGRDKEDEEEREEVTHIF